jgi:hypothetical protein
VSPASSSQRACPHALFTWNNEGFDEKTRTGITVKREYNSSGTDHEGPEGEDVQLFSSFALATR